VRRRGLAENLFHTPPLPAANVTLLLAVIVVFGIGVLAIVLAGGRRGRSEARHRR
jgi:hypothetical protein